MKNQLLTYKQVAEILNVDVSTINKWRKKLLLPYTKIGTRYFYSEADVKKLVEDKNKTDLETLKKQKLISIDVEEIFDQLPAEIQEINSPITPRSYKLTKQQDDYLYELANQTLKTNEEMLRKIVHVSVFISANKEKSFMMLQPVIDAIKSDILMACDSMILIRDRLYEVIFNGGNV